MRELKAITLTYDSDLRVTTITFMDPVPYAKLAVLMSEVRSFRGLYSALAYLPVVIPPVVSVLLWRFFYDASAHGVFNSVLGWFGLGPLPWLQSSASAMPSIVIESTWANAGATVIIYLAALVSVRPELYDAADVDGASIWQKIRNVTLPQLRGVLFVTLILQLIATAQLFTEPFLFTGGGPANSTTTVLLLIYHYAFQNSLGGEYGMAAALSVASSDRFGAEGGPRRHLIPSGCRAHNIGFHDDIGRTADHQQMFDVVAPHQHQPPAAIHGGGVDHRQPRHPPAIGGGTEPAAGESANQPGGNANQRQNGDERENECKCLHALFPADNALLTFPSAVDRNRCRKRQKREIGPMS